MTNPTISVAIIAYNEAERLMDTLKSVQGLADQIVIGIDTRTDDETRQIARTFEAEVFELEWKDDFAGARNQCIDRCTGDWIFMLDGHEVLAMSWQTPKEGVKIVSMIFGNGETENYYCNNPCEFIKPILSKAPDNIDLYSIQVDMQPFMGELPLYSFMQSKIFRNKPEIRYTNKVHAFIGRESVPADRRSHIPDVACKHLPSVKKTEVAEKRHKNINMPSFKEQIPEIKDVYGLLELRMLYQYANALFSIGDKDKAVEMLQKHRKACLSNTSHNEPINHGEYFSVLLSLADYYRQNGMNNFSYLYAMQAHTLMTDRAEPLVALGMCCMNTGDHERAKTHFKQAIDLDVPECPIGMVRVADYTWRPLMGMAVCEANLENIGEAARCAEAVLKYDPDNKTAKEIVSKHDEREKVTV